MKIGKRVFIRPTPEEDRAINRGIAEDPDTFELDAEFFSKTKRGRPFSSNPKTAISVRLDSDVVAALKAGGKGWQTRLNATLREALNL